MKTRHCMYEELLDARLVELKHNVNLIKQRMDRYPHDHLRVIKVNGKSYYCLTDENTRKSRYLRKENISIAKQISQRDYDYNYLKIAEKEIKDIERLLAKSYPLQMESCYSDANKGRKILIDPFTMSEQDYIQNWLERPYKTKGFQDTDTTGFYTEKGERVRSKSEILIANMLLSMNIPYKYECPIQLGQTIIYPDFTILDVKRKQEKYLEHFGMMGDMEYVSSMMLKLSTYERNGIFLGDRLICTFESIKKPLNSSILKEKLEKLVY